MKAAALTEIAPVEQKPVRLLEMPDPQPAEDELLLEVSVCGVCHTELDEIEGRLPVSGLPRILGHQVVGRVIAKGPRVGNFQIGDRVGVTWLWKSCRTCSFCTRGLENLCEKALWTGLDADGGYTERMTVPAAFAHPLPPSLDDLHTAPLLCAGVIGYRALRLCQIEDGQIIGLFGFGASAHLTIQVLRALYPRCRVFAFSRDREHQQQALRLGADWAGHTEDNPPQKMDKVIDFTPIGQAIPLILRNLQKGGKLVINAIRKINPIPPMDYAELLWSERTIQSTANVTYADGSEFLRIAAQIGLKAEVTAFPLEQANEALLAVKHSRITGAAALVLKE
ncbi:MAG: zinc-dependent alcohol dehydrogenase family protein [Anaerohalosphaeraceae bacterium]